MSSKLSQKEQIYEFIKSQGRAKTHEVIIFGANNHINDAKERARQLKSEGLVWRMSKGMKRAVFGECKEEVWSILPEDKEEPNEQAEITATHNLHIETQINQAGQAEFAGMGRVNYGA